MQKRWILVYFLAALLSATFALGLWAGANRLFPYRVVEAALLTAHTLQAQYRRDQPPHTYPSRDPREGVVTRVPDAMQPGPTLITGVWRDAGDWYLGAHLVADDGTLLHAWRLDPAAVWPTSPHRDGIRGSKNHRSKTYVHGSLLYETGELVFNFEGLGLVKVDAAGRVIWTLAYRTHHSVFESDDGSLWVCGFISHETALPAFRGLKPPFYEDTILQVSPDGALLREISVLDALYDSGYQGMLFRKTFTNSGDLTHLNDVEVLGSRMAKAFPMFQAGDILISLRYPNALLVLDGKTEQVKWTVANRFVQQHDPDFLANGTIMVYDNNVEIPAPPGGTAGGTRILAVDPCTRDISVLYGDRPEAYFYSKTGGKQQRLANDNLLITQAHAGRVFEVTREGRMVWDWRAPHWRSKEVAEVLEGTRYPPHYAAFAKTDGTESHPDGSLAPSTNSMEIQAQ